MYNQTIKELVYITPGETVRRNWILEPAINKWNINTTPQGATVTIEDKIIGITPLLDIPVSASIHDVTCVWPGKPPFKSQKDFSIEEGAEGTLQIELPLNLLFPFIIPTKTIKIDGKNNDWSDVQRIDTATFVPWTDPQPKIPGNMFANTLLCQDDTYIYIYMQFSDGKPNYKKGNHFSVQFKNEPGSNTNVALRLENQKNNSNWKPTITINLLSNEENTYKDLWDDGGSISDFKIGKNFIEARFPRAFLFKALNESDFTYVFFYSGIIDGTDSNVSGDYGVVYFK